MKPWRGTDGGGPEPRPCLWRSLGSVLCVRNNSEAGMCLTGRIFSLRPGLFLGCACFVTQTLCARDTYFWPDSVSVFRSVIIQTAWTWTAKTRFICVSHVTRAAIQRVQAICTLIDTLDSTYSLKVDDFFIWCSPSGPMKSSQLPHDRTPLCKYHTQVLLSI